MAAMHVLTCAQTTNGLHSSCFMPDLQTEPSRVELLRGCPKEVPTPANMVVLKGIGMSTPWAPSFVRAMRNSA